ncbi:pectin acetylesterase 8-like, partial [Salvia miltiorrhiza]
MDELLQKGMKNAENALLTGCSAGGLATILHCDEFKSLLPNAKRVKCVADSGFFIRAKDFPGAEGREKNFRNVIDFHKLYDILPKSCTSKVNVSLCLFAEYLVGDVQTPLFLLNPIFDSYQVKYLSPNPPELEGWNTSCINVTAIPAPPPTPNTCTPPQMKFIKDFGATFLDAINGLPDNPS